MHHAGPIMNSPSGHMGASFDGFVLQLKNTGNCACSWWWRGLFTCALFFELCSVTQLHESFGEWKKITYSQLLTRAIVAKKMTMSSGEERLHFKIRCHRGLTTLDLETSISFNSVFYCTFVITSVVTWPKLRIHDGGICLKFKMFKIQLDSNWVTSQN